MTLPNNRLSLSTSASPIVAAFERASRRRAMNADRDSNDQTASAHGTVVTTQSNSSPQLPAQSATMKPPRATHNVLTLAQKVRVLKFMQQYVNEHGEKRLPTVTVTRFPDLFRGSLQAAIMKALRIWRTRDKFKNEKGEYSLKGTGSSFTRVTGGTVKRTDAKALPGRGRKRSAWVDALHVDLRAEFDRLRRLGVKFNLKTLQALAVQLINSSTNDAYHSTTMHPATEQFILSKITARWIQCFCDRYGIVSRALTGKLQLSPAKEEFIQKEVAYHLGKLARAFRSGELQEDDVENADETHFVINLDNGRTLGFKGAEEVKWVDVVSGGEGMTMVVRLSGGRNAKIENGFMVFKNQDRSYPIRGVPDDVEGVAYRTGPKGWMDTTVMPQWLRETRVIRGLPNNRRRVLFVDNCSGHVTTPRLCEAAEDINTEIRYFPKNATHLIQPCDSFVIQKVKSAWSRRWEAHKLEMVSKGQWMDTSGKLRNPGKHFFLKLAAAAIREVNHQRDENGLSYARKAMIRTGMAMNMNNQWEEQQLFPNLQEIIRKHRNHFDGEEVDPQQ